MKIAPKLKKNMFIQSFTIKTEVYMGLRVVVTWAVHYFWSFRQRKLAEETCRGMKLLLVSAVQYVRIAPFNALLLSFFGKLYIAQ